MSSDGLVHRSLPDELLFEIFSRMSPYTLGRAACICRNWRYTIHNSVFWHNACLRAWQISGTAENYRILLSKYDGSWRKMWLLRPRVRTDGVLLPVYTILSFWQFSLQEFIAKSKRCRKLHEFPCFKRGSCFFMGITHC